MRLIYCIIHNLRGFHNLLIEDEQKRDAFNRIYK